MAYIRSHGDRYPVLMGARSNPPVELRPSTDRLERPALRRRVLQAENAQMVELYQAGLSALYESGLSAIEVA